MISITFNLESYQENSGLESSTKKWIFLCDRDS